MLQKIIVIMTTKGFIPKTADDNPFQTHRSEWNNKEFMYRGYEVRFLPDFGDIKWVIFPFVIIYVFGLNAKLLMAVKHKTKE